MTARDFCYWLQGYFEIHHAGDATSSVIINRGITSERVAVIEKHLALVFKHEIDPSQGDTAHQQELNKIHSVESMADAIIRC